jgi:GGDEF domain-containing protein
MKSDGEKPGIAILFIHLSNLREVSTVLGQDIADGAIRNVSSRLKTALESPPDNAEFGAECLLDAKLARYDEQSLVITLPACLERDPIHSFAQYLHGSLRTPMQILGEEMLMSPYVGIPTTRMMPWKVQN